MWGGGYVSLLQAVLLSCAYARKWRQGLEGESLDLIHFNNTPQLGEHYLPIARARRIPVFTHVRKVRPLSRLEHFVIKRARGVVALSHTQKATLIKQGIPADKIKVVYNPWPRVRESLPFPTTPCWGVVSSLAAGKGHDLFVQAFSRFEKEHPQSGLKALLRAPPGIHSSAHGHLEYRPHLNEVKAIYEPLSLMVDPSQIVEGF